MDIENLDYTLARIERMDITHALSFTQIYEEGYGMSQFEQVLCLEKLTKDGFAQISYGTIENKVTGERIDQKNDPHYNITYDGFIFLKNGGYKKDFARKNYSYTLTKIEVWAVILGGGFAALYYSVEIVRIFFL